MTRRRDDAGGRCGFPLTDAGNAERLAGRAHDEVRHCPALGWLRWDGKRWLRDEAGHVHQVALRTVREIPKEAVRASDMEREEHARFARFSEAQARLAAMVRLAATNPSLVVARATLDADPWLLNCENGTLDLSTGQLRAHAPADLLAKLAPVKFDPNAQCPEWERFLSEIQPDPGARTYLQEFFGSALTGAVRDHVLPVLCGAGGNGKSTIIETIQDVLGDYAVHANPELLIAKAASSHPTERATLLGVRLAVCSETEQGSALSEVMVKQLTGGDRINARYMHRDEFQFDPTHKLVMVTNHRPRVRGDDEGIWRRLVLVPFGVNIPKAHQDPGLRQRLRIELPGILRWCVEGCASWRRRGRLEVPRALRDATLRYRAATDPIGAFLEECCAEVAGATTRSAALHVAFVRWCKRQGIEPASPQALGRHLTARGFEGYKSHGNATWRGIDLRSDAERAPRNLRAGDEGDDSRSLSPSHSSLPVEPLQECPHPPRPTMEGGRR